MKPDFNSTARKLIKHKIQFTTSDSEPRFEIQNERFTTQELIQLQEDKLTNSGLSEIIRTRRMAAASKVAGPQISSNKG